MMHAVNGISNGDSFITHPDIPEETPNGFDAHFLIVSEDYEPAYLVCIQRIEPMCKKEPSPFRLRPVPRKKQ